MTLGWLPTLSGPSEGQGEKPQSPKGLMGALEQGCGVRPQARVPKETEAQRGVASCRSSCRNPGNLICHLGPAPGM